MLEQLLRLAADPSDEPELRRQIRGFVQSLLASVSGGDRTLVGRAEAAVKQDPSAALAFDATGVATLHLEQITWQAGRFETPSIAELRQRARERSQNSDPGRARLWVLDGMSPATDIGSLQATAGAGALFQVASQFNCLESPGPYVVDVADYFHDPTQGPRASISAFPGTLLRHYAAPTPDGGRFVQRDGGPQIDLLADVFAQGQSPVRSGYLWDHGGAGPAALVNALEANFDRIRVGVHDAVQVVLGHNWDGAVDGADCRITQVFTSTVAGGDYGGQQELGAAFAPACRQTLRAGYLGTLLAAVGLGRSLVVLTLIGGGVFRNPAAQIWEAILWAFDEVQPLAVNELDVVLNGYNLSTMIDLRSMLPALSERGGAVLRFGPEGLVGVLR
jgi:hypothetical protein